VVVVTEDLGIGFGEMMGSLCFPQLHAFLIVSEL
jgi:hypothetical protein